MTEREIKNAYNAIIARERRERRKMKSLQSFPREDQMISFIPLRGFSPKEIRELHPVFTYLIGKVQFTIPCNLFQ